VSTEWIYAEQESLRRVGVHIASLDDNMAIFFAKAWKLLLEDVATEL